MLPISPLCNLMLLWRNALTQLGDLGVYINIIIFWFLEPPPRCSRETTEEEKKEEWEEEGNTRGWIGNIF